MKTVLVYIVYHINMTAIRKNQGIEKIVTLYLYYKCLKLKSGSAAAEKNMKNKWTVDDTVFDKYWNIDVIILFGTSSIFFSRRCLKSNQLHHLVDTEKILFWSKY